MSKRLFLKNLLLLGPAEGLPLCLTQANSLHAGKFLETSTIAGFQYYQGDAIWTQLYAGAVRIDYQGHKLGYLPKLDNVTASQLLDRLERIEGCIAKLQVSDDPWQRVEVEVRWVI